jgi:predicted AAA+ superfamily ATPase
LSQRFNLDELQRESNNIVLVDEEQLATIEELKNVMKNGEEDLAKYLKRINIDIITDLSYEQANTMIKQMKKKLGVTAK